MSLSPISEMLVIVLSSAGMVPVRLLSERMKFSRLVIILSSLGMVPVSEFDQS